MRSQCEYLNAIPRIDEEMHQGVYVQRKNENGVFWLWLRAENRAATQSDGRHPLLFTGNFADGFSASQPLSAGPLFNLLHRSEGTADMPTVLLY